MSREEKKAKKNYKQVPNEEWIEMEDLNQPRNQQLSKKLALEGNRQYQRPYEKEQIIPEQTISFKQQKASQPAQNLPFANKQNIQAERTKKKRLTPSLPMMEVTCDFCTVSQQVPGNTQVYSCGSCQGMNECYPLYGIATCDCCQSNVGFGFGISQYIKCPKCSSILRVPLEPKKHYESVAGMVAQSHLLPSVYQPEQKPQRKPQKIQEEFWQERELEAPGKMRIEPSEVVIEQVQPQDI